MSDSTSRRGYLLSAIQAANRPVRTGDAERLLAVSQWSCHRNTARKDLRGLARAGLLTAVDIDGRRIYHPTTLKGGGS